MPLTRQRGTSRPPTLVIVGETGVGKSTTINALFNAGQPVGHTKATTMNAIGIDVYLEHVQGGHGDLLVYDMPGLGDNMANYQRYLELYSTVLPEADVVLWVHPSTQRMIQFTQQALRDLSKLLPGIFPHRVVFGLNKADEMQPGDWNPISNLPSVEQERNIRERTQDFVGQLALPSRKTQVVAYSALRRYNLPTLFGTLMKAVPKKRRWVLESRMDLADFLELADQGLVAQARQYQKQKSAPEELDQQTPHKQYRQATTFEEYLDQLPDDEYRSLVSERHRLIEAMRVWDQGIE